MSEFALPALERLADSLEQDPSIHSDLPMAMWDVLRDGQRMPPDSNEIYELISSVRERFAPWGIERQALSNLAEAIEEPTRRDQVPFETIAPVLTYAAGRAVAERFGAWEERPWDAPWADRDLIVRAAEAVTRLTMRRGPCLGQCPIYTLAFHADGAVEFIGEEFVDMIGPHTSAIPASDFTWLAAATTYLDTLVPGGRDRPTGVLDLASEKVEIARGAVTIPIGARTARSTCARLMDEAAADLEWYEPDGCSVGPPAYLHQRQSDERQPHWTKRRGSWL